MDEFFEVAKVNEIPPGGKKLVEVDGYPVALFNVNGEFYAIEDVCTHDGGPLAEGELDGNEIECPRHGARFNVCTGAALCMPAIEPVECYEVKVEGDAILVSAEGEYR
jgi:3-phenylpropionate/trans-cinnamate dioxygenase ferredoxin subunit